MLVRGQPGPFQEQCIGYLAVMFNKAVGFDKHIRSNAALFSDCRVGADPIRGVQDNIFFDCDRIVDKVWLFNLKKV